MKRLVGRVAIVTGAGRGLGRAHALFLASQGAAVVVNDRGGTVHGEGADATPAQAVVAEIEAAGGVAAVSDHDVADWDQAAALIDLAVSRFGDLHVLVNNAGILRDRTLANMSEAEWDAVQRVHLKGHAAPTRHAMAYWRGRSKAGAQVQASIIHTTSVAGFSGNFGQANYAAAKLGIVALSHTVALEGRSFGVRSNAVSPSARTRIALSVPGAGDALRPPADPAAFDHLDPANVSPLIGWLGEAACPATAQVFHLIGDRLFLLAIPSIADEVRTDGRWTLEALDAVLPSRLVTQLPANAFFGGMIA
jgi:NAD(P)-dependent dehydrogenase (short-subunit alcohol dehydrogenase family)